MFSRLDHPPVSYEDYRPLLDPELADQLAAVAAEMGQLRVHVPLQMLAYHVALLLNRDVDQPRNLAKSVTVE